MSRFTFAALAPPAGGPMARSKQCFGAGVVASMLAACGSGHPEPFATWLDGTRSFHTLYSSTEGEVTVQVDLDRGAFAVEHGTSRVYWDGGVLRLVALAGVDGGQDPQVLPDWMSAHVRDVWDEWRAGLPRTQVVEVSPPSRLAVAPDARVFEVTLPFRWAEGYDVYVVTDAAGTVGTLHPFRAGRPVLLPPVPNAWCPPPPEVAQLTLGGVATEYDVSLDPQTWQPTVATRPSWAWHHELSISLRAEDVGPSLSVSCVLGDEVAAEEHHARFSLPDEPDLAARALAQLARCPSTWLTVGYYASRAAGTEACVDSALAVQDGSGATFTRSELHACGSGRMYADVPRLGPLDTNGLQVVLHDSRTVRCSERGGRAQVFPPDVELSSPGCLLLDAPYPPRNLHSHVTPHRPPPFVDSHGNCLRPDSRSGG